MTMNLPCNDAQLLIMSYLDGELSEAQAAPLRKHLLECQPCRASAQDHKNTTRWFVQPEPVAVPRDFAARVARRAFQGDRGERLLEATPAALPFAAQHDERRILRFVIGLTAVAAAAVICLSIAVRSLTLPASDRLAADDRTPALPLEDAVRELDVLNASEAAKSGAQDAPSPGTPAQGDPK
jgi:anti-sigma factor RsiW